MKRADRLIVRVSPLSPGFHPSEPREWSAVLVDPVLKFAPGRGVSPGAALDDLRAKIEFSVIVDLPGGGQ